MHKPVISTNLIQIRQVHANTPTAGGASALSPTIQMLPLNSPPINGFTPWVAIGMTDENNEDDLSFAAYDSTTPGSAPNGPWHTMPTPGTPRYAPAIFDTGSSAHLITLHEWETTFNLPGAGRDGIYEAQLSGAGTAVENALMNDAAGLYLTGLQNASTSGSGSNTTISVAPGTLKGQYNVSVLSAESAPPQSILPNILGSPILSQYQAVFRNSRQRSITYQGDTLASPSIDLTALATNSKVPGGYSRMDLVGEPAGNFTTPASYFPDPNNFITGDPVTDNPTSPTQWAALENKENQSWVNGTDSGTGNPGGSFSTQKFLFDTGAQATVLSTSTASAVGFKLTGENPSTPEFFVEVGGVGGVSQNVPGFYMDSLTLHTNGDDLIFTHVPVIVLDIGDPSGSGNVPGIIGMNLFTDRDLILNGGTGQPGPYIAIGPLFREWTHTGGGNWSDAIKWSTGTVPNNLNTPALFRGAITAPAVVNVDSNFTVGSLTFDSANAYTLAGSGRITLQTSAETTAISASQANIWVGAGSHTISAPMTFAVNTTIETDKAASMITISSDVTATTTAITKLGPGVLQMKNVRAAGLTIGGGIVRILANGGQSGTSKVGQLSGISGQLDLKDNDLVVTGGTVGTATGGVYDGISGMIQSGRNGGAWTGSGIVTSMSAATTTHLTTLGIATASQAKGIAAGSTSTWSGQTVTGSDALVMYTYGGDANLDGKINVDDYGRIDFNVKLLGASGWFNGDFNYDGKINVDDYGIIDFNIAIQGPPLLSAAGGDPASAVSSVPEPAGAAILLLISGIPLLRRQRRRNRA